MVTVLRMFNFIRLILGCPFWLIGAGIVLIGDFLAGEKFKDI